MSSRAAIVPPVRGVRIAGVGSCLPDRVITNADLEQMMDTSDDWIVQRTGIRERRRISEDESTTTLGTEALRRALADAEMDASELDLIITATMTPEMACPPVSCRLADNVDARSTGAMDLSAACCGFVYSLNIAHALIKGGAHRAVAVVGSDTLTELMDYSNAGRATAIIFGDAAGSAILRADDDPSLGVLAQVTRCDGAGWKDIYVPHRVRDFPADVEPDSSKFGYIQMNGRRVFKFAVGTFPDLIQETLDLAGLSHTDIDQYICHQSNARILSASRDRFGIPEDKFLINITYRGNTVAASVPLCLDELRRSGRIHEGQKLMFVAFGGGLTWGSSLWQI